MVECMVVQGIKCLGQVDKYSHWTMTNVKVIENAVGLLKYSMFC